MFYDHRLSVCVEKGFQGGPMWNTTVIPNEGGYEARIQNWDMPLYKFVASYNEFDPADQSEIGSAVVALRGQTDSFRFKDWRDFKLNAEPLGTGDGTATPRQLRKYYTFGPATRARIIRLPVSGFVVLANGTTPVSVTVDANGMLTPTSVWPNGQILTVSGEFDVRVRFASDYYPFTMPENDLARVSIDLIETRTP